MIAIITLESSLVPLIEGLHDDEAQIHMDSTYWCCVHIFFFALSAGKIWKRKNAVSPRSHPTSQHIYIHVCTLYTCTNTYMPRLSPSRFFRPSKCLVPTPGLASENPTFSVRVHTHTRTYTPTPSKNREHTDKISIFPQVNNTVPHQQQVPCID